MVAPNLRTSDPGNPKPGQAQIVPLPISRVEDRAIVQGLREGSSTAFSQLYDRFATLVRGLILRVMGNDHGVDDLIHEVFLTIVRRCRDIRKPESLQAFIHGVAVRSARDELRRRRLRKWIGWNDLPQSALPIRSQEPCEREAVAHIYQALEMLPVDCRLAFSLRHIEGMELAEAADACEWSLSTFKRRLNRAERQFDAIATNDPVLRGVMAERKGRG